MNSSNWKSVVIRGIKTLAFAAILTAASGCVSGPVGGPHPFTTMFEDYPPPHAPQVMQPSELSGIPIAQTAIR